MIPRDVPDLESFQEEYWKPLGSLEVDRRDFLKLLGGGLLICLVHPSAGSQESGRTFGGHELPKDVGAWLHITADGKVQAFTGKVEVGQNIRTSLAQAVAEELHVPFDSVTMVMGDTALTPWDMGTFGSRTTPTMAPQLRAMAVAARQMLVQMAAERWHVAPDGLKAADAKVADSENARSLSYGELTRGENLVKVISTKETLTPSSEWKIAGTPVPKAEGRDFVTGKQAYPSDIVRPGMLFGAVLRPDGYNATLESTDTSAAEKLAGVQVVRDGSFTGVVAADSHTAQKAVSAINAKWNVPAQPSNRDLFDYLKNNQEPGRGSGSQPNAASVQEAIAAADLKLDARYTVQYIAHAPLEPRAAVAEWDGDKLTVWTGTQRPFGVREELAQAFHIPESQVRVIQPDMGSGYGGKHTGETAVEAARLAKAAGKPVKVVWSRQEEFTWAYFRPAGLIEINAGIKRDGTLVAWDFHNYNSGSAAIETPYAVANQNIQYHPVRSPLRQGSYRSLAAAANHFARESHMDSLAKVAAMEPMQFRMKNLTDVRLRAVVEAAANKFGWSSSKSTPDRGFGIACGTDKGGFVATCVEIQINPSTKMVRILRVVQAWESGAIVNPDGLRNQNEGAIMQGIGGALFERILFENGRILNPRFAQYRLPRFSDAPKIEIVLLDRKDLPSAGAGESGLVCVAPAIGNAIFAATGTRLRGLPMLPKSELPGEPESPLHS
jgi:isoquinoline 1-oxidoreductase